jgi:hypothetical protein
MDDELLRKLNEVVGHRPVRRRVRDSPYQPGDGVQIVGAIDREIHDVSEYVGKKGTVDYLEYECGCGQIFPEVPMVGVVFPGGKIEEFWPEELQHA